MANVYATWNPADKHAELSLALNANNLVVTNTTTNFRSIRGTIGKSTGLAFFEVTRSDANYNMTIGFADSTFGLTAYIGASAISAGFSYLNVIQANGITKVGTGFGDTAVAYIVALDFTNKKGYVGKANAWANSADPIAGTNPSFTWTGTPILFPAVSINSTTANLTLNAGQSAFSNTTLASALVANGWDNGWFTNTGNDLLSVISKQFRSRRA
jgi:hypothetical protein